jgi:hypothetical protein
LREIDLALAKNTNRQVRYFGLHAGDDGVTVEQGPEIEDAGDIAALDEELEQATAYLKQSWEEQ